MKSETLEWSQLKEIDALYGAFGKKLDDRVFCENLIKEMKDFETFSKSHLDKFIDFDEMRDSVWQVLIPDLVNVT